MAAASIDPDVQSAQVAQQVATSVAVKAQKVTKQQGDAAVALLESARVLQDRAQAASARGGVDVVG